MDNKLFAKNLNLFTHCNVLKHYHNLLIKSFTIQGHDVNSQNDIISPANNMFILMYGISSFFSQC